LNLTINIKLEKCRYFYNKTFSVEIIYMIYCLLSEKATKASLSTILVFATGSDSIPPLGFSPLPSVSFIHKKEEGQNFISKYPMANTCANELRLPVIETYEEFGILNSPGFGRI
jgi:hypothetical protein